MTIDYEAWVIATPNTRNKRNIVISKNIMATPYTKHIYSPFTVAYYHY